MFRTQILEQRYTGLWRILRIKLPEFPESLPHTSTSLYLGAISSTEAFLNLLCWIMAMLAGYEGSCNSTYLEQNIAKVNSRTTVAKILLLRVVNCTKVQLNQWGFSK